MKLGQSCIISYALNVSLRRVIRPNYLLKHSKYYWQDMTYLITYYN